MCCAVSELEKMVYLGFWVLLIFFGGVLFFLDFFDCIFCLFQKVKCEIILGVVAS